MPKYLLHLLTLVLFMTMCGGADAQKFKKDYLVVFYDQNGNCGYKNCAGREVIPIGTFPYIFTDTFYSTAIVQDEKQGIVAIDRKGNILYRFFIFDNGPDYSADGLYRICEGGKYGFASLDHVVIPPMFDFVYPFSDDRAVYVSGCTFRPDACGEHTEIVGGTYGYIDQRGRVLRSAVYTSATSFKNGTATVTYEGRKIKVDRNFKPLGE